MKFIRVELVFVCFLTIGLSAQPQFSVLLYTKTAGWHHGSIHEGVKAMRVLSERHQFDLSWSDHADRYFNDEQLARFDVVVFLNTTGDVLSDKEQAAFERFIQSGKGFVGIHSASDTEYDWEWYTKLVGRTFVIHPAIQTAQVSVLEQGFVGLETWPGKIWLTDEWYEFSEEKVPGLNYLLSIDETTYDPNADWGEVEGDGMGDFHPISWYHEYDGGRCFYTALGHVPAMYSNDLFLSHLYGGIFWAANGVGGN